MNLHTSLLTALRILDDAEIEAFIVLASEAEEQLAEAGSIWPASWYGQVRGLLASELRGRRSGSEVPDGAFTELERATSQLTDHEIAAISYGVMLSNLETLEAGQTAAAFFDGLRIVIAAEMTYRGLV